MFWLRFNTFKLRYVHNKIKCTLVVCFHHRCFLKINLVLIVLMLIKHLSFN
jgi:hypothetical protein